MSIKENNLDLFSERLTLELKGILSPLSGAEQSDVRIQEIGRHIAQFVFLKETQNSFRNKGGSNDKMRISWI